MVGTIMNVSVSITVVALLLKSITLLEQKSNAQFSEIDQEDSRIIRSQDTFLDFLENSNQSILPPRTDHSAPGRKTKLYPQAICVFVEELSLKDEQIISWRKNCD